MTENKMISQQQKNISDKVLTRVKDMEKLGDISFPKKYSYQNALKSAYLILSETVDRNKQPVLKSCSQESICNCLLDMVIQGLSPVKNQCYFVPYNGKLQLMKSYLGNIAATKRLEGIKDVFANVVYQEDVFEYEIDLNTGLKKITKHEQKMDNIDLTKIKGAYAVITKENGPSFVEVMTIDQIKKAWNQGPTKGNSGAHNNFTDEMAKKTVINRACKIFVKTSDDSDILLESINRTNEYNPEDIIEVTQTEVKEEVKEEANKEFIDIEEVTPVEVGMIEDDNDEEAPY